MEALADRARAAALEIELERTAAETQRLDAGRHDATQQAGRMVTDWLRDQRIDHTSWTMGPPDPQPARGRWRVPVTFQGPTPDDDLTLLLEVELGDPEGAWHLPKTCAVCRQDYATPAGWHLHDIGRALAEGRRHECDRGAAVVVEVTALVSHGSCWKAAQRLAELEDRGYMVDTHVTSGKLVIVARQQPLAVDSQTPF